MGGVRTERSNGRSFDDDSPHIMQPHRFCSEHIQKVDSSQLGRSIRVERYVSLLTYFVVIIALVNATHASPLTLLVR